MFQNILAMFVDFPFSAHRHASLDQVHVDVTDQLHRVSELVLVVCFSSLCLNVLLNGVDLTLVVDKFLLDIVQFVVDIRLKNLIFLSVMLHLLISNLFIKARSIDIKETFNEIQSLLFFLILSVEFILLGEFGRHLFLHLLHFEICLFNLVTDSLIKMLYFF